MKLSVVIPAYNEEENIEQAVKAVAKRFPGAEIIVVNDKSTDKTLEILKSLQDKIANLIVITNDVNSGHGKTVVNGLLAASKDYILYIDADQQIELSNFLCSEKLDVISGYRVDRKDKPFRLIITRILKYTNLLRHRCFIRDANCPFKIYRRDKIQALIARLPESYIIPVACLQVLAKKNHLRVIEIPVYHQKYHSERIGFLQTINRKSIAFCWKAFIEVMKL